MYYIDEEQINRRLQYIPELIDRIRLLQENFEPTNILHGLAQERLLQLSIETVTDIGSYLIDGYMLREASSYEDIIEVLEGEQVMAKAVAAHLLQLVRLRKPLLQEYIGWPSNQQHPVLLGLPQTLHDFSSGAKIFMEKERL